VILLIIVAVIVFLFLVLRRILNRIVRHSSNMGWDAVLASPSTDSMFHRDFEIENFTYPVAKVLKPLKVNYVKFMSNLLCLSYEGDELRMNLDKGMRYITLQTPSIAHYRDFLNRPLLPLWFLAAFPDVVDWINSDDFEKSEVLYEGIDEGLLEAGFQDWGDSQQKTDVVRGMIEYYLKKVRPALETQ